MKAVRFEPLTNQLDLPAAKDFTDVKGTSQES